MLGAVSIGEAGQARSDDATQWIRRAAQAHGEAESDRDLRAVRLICDRGAASDYLVQLSGENKETAPAAFLMDDRIGDRMDPVDRVCASASLNHAETGFGTLWLTPSRCGAYILTPTTPLVGINGRQCRGFTLKELERDVVAEVYRTACRTSDGTWEATLLISGSSSGLSVFDGVSGSGKPARSPAPRTGRSTRGSGPADGR